MVEGLKNIDVQQIADDIAHEVYGENAQGPHVDRLKKRIVEIYEQYPEDQAKRDAMIKSTIAAHTDTTEVNKGFIENIFGRSFIKYYIDELNKIDISYYHDRKEIYNIIDNISVLEEYVRCGSYGGDFPDVLATSMHSSTKPTLDMIARYRSVLLNANRIKAYIFSQWLQQLDSQRFKYMSDYTIPARFAYLQMAMGHAYLEMKLKEDTAQDKQKVINDVLVWATGKRYHGFAKWICTNYEDDLLAVINDYENYTEAFRNTLSNHNIYLCSLILEQLNEEEQAELLANKHNGYFTCATAALFIAAQYGNIDVIRFLLENGADIDDKNYGGFTPLHIAAKYGEIKAMITILSYASKEHKVELLATKDNSGKTALHIAAENGKIDVIRFLLENGAEVNAKDRSGATPLYTPIKYGHTDIVKLLIKEGAEVDITNRYVNQTPLHWAVKNGRFDIVKFLLENGADINAIDNAGETPLHLAVKNGRFDIVKLILSSVSEEQKMNLLATENGYGYTPLHIAIRYGKIEIMITILSSVTEEQKMDLLTTKDSYDDTPLHTAIEYGNIKFIKLLLENGADINAKDKLGNTLLHFAAKYGKLEIVKLLLENGVDVNAKDNAGKTPLRFAVKNGHIDIVDLVLSSVTEEQKMNLLATKDSYDDTPLHTAIREGHIDIVKLILSYASEEQKMNLLATENGYGGTPLHIAIRYGETEVVRTILSSVTEEQKMDLLTTKDSSGNPALHLAAQHGETEVVRTILSSVSENQKLELLTTNNSGNTPLHSAARHGEIEIVRDILNSVTEEQKMSLLATQDNSGCTPLHLAARCGKTEAVKAILSYASEEQKMSLLATQDNSGCTPLHLAARCGKTEAVKAILSFASEEQKMNLLVTKDNSGNTPLHIAAERGHTEVVAFLGKDSINKSLFYSFLTSAVTGIALEHVIHNNSYYNLAAISSASCLFGLGAQYYMRGSYNDYGKYAIIQPLFTTACTLFANHYVKDNIQAIVIGNLVTSVMQFAYFQYEMNKYDMSEPVL